MNTNEIEFLPEWYRKGRRNRRLLRDEYLALGAVVAAVLVWNFLLSVSLSRISSEISADQERGRFAGEACAEFVRTKEMIKGYQKKAAGFSKLGSVVNVGDVMAELSYLIGDKIAVSKLELKAESFGKGGAVTAGKGTLRSADSNRSKGDDFLTEDVRFRIFICGVASDSADVAELVCKMEGSEYFCEVVPSFSGNLKFNLPEGSKVKSNMSTQFEVYSYLGNYRIENAFAANKVK